MRCRGGSGAFGRAHSAGPSNKWAARRTMGRRTGRGARTASGPRSARPPASRCAPRLVSSSRRSSGAPSPREPLTRVAARGPQAGGRPVSPLGTVQNGLPLRRPTRSGGPKAAAPRPAARFLPQQMGSLWLSGPKDGRAEVEWPKVGRRQYGVHFARRRRESKPN